MSSLFYRLQYWRSKILSTTLHLINSRGDISAKITEVPKLLFSTSPPNRQQLPISPTLGALAHSDTHRSMCSAHPVTYHIQWAPALVETKHTLVNNNGLHFPGALGLQATESHHYIHYKPSAYHILKPLSTSWPNSPLAPFPGQNSIVSKPGFDFGLCHSPKNNLWLSMRKTRVFKCKNGLGFPT